MGTCKLCGKPAGLFRNTHAACESARGIALSNVKQAVLVAVRSAADDASIRAACEQAKAAHATDQEIREALVRGWESAADHFLDDGLLDETEERHLVRVQEALDLSQQELEVRGAYSRIVKAAVLRELMAGTVPDGVRIEGDLPFNYQKGERTIWLFQGVEYLEDKTRRHYVGGSHGASIRIAKGVYYRVGAFKGTPVERTERVTVDRGLLAVTNKHIYFGGSAKSFRVRHDKIVSYIPFSDGVGIVRDAASAKPQVFVTGDGWFSYNLLSNVAQL